MQQISVRSDWVPAQHCTLPTAEQPFRLAEFERLFRSAMRTVTRVSPTLLQLELDASAEQTARDLAQRESGCCSFFTFTFASGRETVQMDIAVPQEHTDVLAGIAAQAGAAIEAIQ